MCLWRLILCSSKSECVMVNVSLYSRCSLSACLNVCNSLCALHGEGMIAKSLCLLGLIISGRAILFELSDNTNQVSLL